MQRQLEHANTELAAQLEKANEELQAHRAAAVLSNLTNAVSCLFVPTSLLEPTAL